MKHMPNLKLALVLTPGIFLLLSWILALSSGPLLARMGIFRLALWAALISFGIAYSVTLFFVELGSRD